MATHYMRKYLRPESGGWQLLIFIGDSFRRKTGGDSPVFDSELWINVLEALAGSQLYGGRCRAKASAPRAAGQRDWESRCLLTVARVVSTAQLFNDSAAPECQMYRCDPIAGLTLALPTFVRGVFANLNTIRQKRLSLRSGLADVWARREIVSRIRPIEREIRLIITNPNN